MNFEQMEVVNGGQAIATVPAAIDDLDPARIDWCRTGKWITGIGIILIGMAAGAIFGVIAGSTTIFC
jgi:hypothetical protein